MELDIVSLSRLQFAITALYHFLFVPLTLGLSVLLAIMETVYVMTGRLIWRQMTKFWGTLFGINFVMGVATGVVMEFQFGMNWSYYSHYVGDIFGAPLAIEGLMAFFLEATFVGLFFFGWDRLSKVGHLMATYAVAAGSNFSALWILIANGWMQNPVGSAFNPETMRMEITDFFAVLMNPVAQAKFVHTVSAGYVTASVFVLGVSAWYLLKGRSVELAKRSMTIAASFGLAATLSVVVLGDESGYLANEHQKMKIAAIEAMWETEPAPASFTVFGFPDQAARETHFAVHIPWVMGLIGTRSLTTPIQGINDLVESAENHIRNGIVAYDALQKIRAAGDTNAVPQEVKDVFADNSQWMGYALLLKRYVDDPRQATDAQITQAANDTVPGVLPLFWAFRIMVGIGFFLILLTGTFFVLSARRKLDRYPFLLRIAVFAIPLPWIAAEMGWIVAEFGRQPWVIEGILPTAVGVSNLGASTVLLTILGFVAIYTVLFIIEMGLMIRAIKAGPEPDSKPEAMLAPASIAPAGVRIMILSDLLDYETLRLIWWVLLGVLLIAFAAMDGFDLGVDILMPVVGKTDVERRIIINTIGPVWEGNQVWLILGGGAIFAAWPQLYAVSFSGFYLAMFVILFALILRPVGFKYRSKRESEAWRRGWDWALFIGGFVPALIFGVAVGNVLQGVPFRIADDFQIFYEGSFFGLLNPFALLCGVLSVTMLCMHGASWLMLKTTGDIQARARSYGSIAALLTVVLYVLAGVVSWFWVSGYRITSAIVTDGPSNPLRKTVELDHGAWFTNYVNYPVLLIAPALGILGALAVFIALRSRRELAPLLFGKLSIFGIISSVGVSMFPFILPSSLDPRSSLTVWDSSSSHMTLFIMLVVTLIFLPLIVVYTSWVYKVLWGKVDKDMIEDDSNHAY